MELENGTRNHYYKLAQPKETRTRILKRLAALDIDVEWEARHRVCPDIFWCALRSRMLDLASNGKGVDPVAAEASACAEFVERLSFPMQWVKRVHPDVYTPEIRNLADYGWVAGHIHCHEADLGEAHLSVEDVFSSQWVYADQDSIRFFRDAELSLTWVDGYSLIGERSIKVPVRLLEWVGSSNGLAAGNTRAEAVLQATFELFERHAALSIVVGERPVPVLEVTGVETDRIRRMRSFLRRHGIETLFFDASLHGLLPCVGLLARNTSVPADHMEHDLLFFGASFDLEERMTRCLIECMQGRTADPTTATVAVRAAYDRPVVSNPDNYTPLFSYGIPTKPVSFIDTSTRIAADRQFTAAAPADITEEIAAIRAICQALSSDWVAVDIGHPGVGFPVVRVVIPRLLTRISCITPEGAEKRRVILPRIMGTANGQATAERTTYGTTGLYADV